MHANANLMGLVAACVTDKIHRVTKQLGKKNGGILLIAKQRQMQIQLAYRLHKRFTEGDYRATDLEAGSIRDLCQWLVSEHRRMNQSEDKIVDFEELLQPEEPPEGTYQRVCEAVLSA